MRRHPPTHRSCQTFRFAAWQWCLDTAEELIRADGEAAATFYPKGGITTLDPLLPLEPARPGFMRLIVIEIDHDYAMTQTNLAKPIIVAPVAPEKGDNGVIVIDGWHRVYRARKEGREHLPTYLLTPYAEKASRIPVFIG
ncbi:hypothetical protein SAMN05421810_101101 [Amycolatopsis arida]|uniref:ParB-like nuclease domain-containing protein n=1 Tax=Amycolatopsis arida TaxID=587909 RepID=A0A1I5KE76_9PSEU|nr:hypothetical protein [Amycolatopsis arida]TDX96997.1 hypothetical protein CLV69_10299 [Amycolatopsis arida]SFO83033.1 hypothetical protein SAMN05421810_101101 [Amycolatopsis arida]